MRQDVDSHSDQQWTDPLTESCGARNTRRDVHGDTLYRVKHNQIVSQLVLGTAQFSDGYGITNERGRLSDTEVAGILDLALESGVTHIDTAAVYGDALERLRPWSSAFTFTGKIVGTDSVDPVQQVSSSLSVLGCEKFEACLVREWDQLDETQRDDVVDRMIHAQQVGLVDRIGVAAYTREDVRTFREHLHRADHEVGALQVPSNPIDRRFDDDDDVQVLAKCGADLAVRSVFLQGLLLQEDQRVFASHPDLRKYWAQVSERRPRSAISVCLGHVKALEWATQVVVGVSSLTEWREILSCWSKVTPDLLPESVASDDQELLDPRRWNG